MDDAESLDLLRRRVVNVVGHELRTPVTIVRGLAESLAVAPDDTVRASLTDALVRSSARLEALVDQLLLATGVHTAAPVGETEDVEVEPALRAAGWTALVDGGGTVRARRAALQLILDPIVDNASRHGEPVIARVYNGTIEIESAGPDLPPGDAELATEPFYRGEQAVMSRPGLGLGLAIARTVARSEGGDVLATRRDGGGMIVCVTLPVGGVDTSPS